ncbi:hypothetical protein BJV74DRAFT_855407 [Russula compacta]|nr:hypothetical protein BJV74DRAFT_855407 [Russula compacta]
MSRLALGHTISMIPSAQNLEASRPRDLVLAIVLLSQLHHSYATTIFLPGFFIMKTPNPNDLAIVLFYSHC